MEREDATVLFFSEIAEVVRVPSASICALSPRSTVDKQVIDVLTGWTRCAKGFVNTSSASQLLEVLEQVIEVPSCPMCFQLVRHRCRVEFLGTCIRCMCWRLRQWQV